MITFNKVNIQGKEFNYMEDAIENGVRYINIEVRLGLLSQQRKMLKYVEDVLRR